MLTIPLVLPLVDGSWRWALALWGLPLVLIAILIAALAPAPKEVAAAAPPAGRSWWPDWSNKLIWQGGLLIGSINSAFFCSNAFLAWSPHQRRTARLDRSRADRAQLRPHSGVICAACARG
jgi:CP family cyanate transporter-like MFS transporter